MAVFDILSNRAVGQYPLSIATSLAIESALGVHPDIVVTKPPVLEYEQLWINARTLFRNLYGAVERQNLGFLTPPELAITIAEEMETIISLISVQSNTEVVYYFSNMAGMEKKYKHAVLRRDSTEKQKEYTMMLNTTVDLLLKDHSDEIHGFDLKLKPEGRPKALILTHHPYDLVAWKEFSFLTLLESHTGALKERAQWYTKYQEGRELPMIPFREDFLQVFGDAIDFRPMDIRVRKELIEVATKYQWSAITTTEKIAYGIGQMQNPLARVILKDMLVH